MSYQDFITQVGVGAASRRLIKVELDGIYDLQWPAASIQEMGLLPDFFIIEGGSSGSIRLPDGRSGSAGSSCVFINRSDADVPILNSANQEIRVLLPGVIVSAILEDTVSNLWSFFEVGEAPSQATANDLIGPGMGASNAKLFPSILTYDFNVDQAMDVNRRAQLYNWTGGGGVLSLPDATTWPGGYYAYIRNKGTSTLAIRPDGVNLNGSSSDYTLSVGESVVVTFDGTEWKTFLDNIAPPLVFNAGSVSLPASGTKVLTPFEKSFEIQTFTGALTNSVTVEYGNSVGVWFVRDGTTGGKLITMKASTADAGVTPGSGFTAVIINDGNAVTYASPSAGTVTSVGTSPRLTGGPITSSGTIDLATTGVSAGSYGGGITTFPGFTVDAYGRLTAATTADLRASNAEALAGTNNTKIMTPLRTAERSVAKAGDDMTGQLRGLANASASEPSFSFTGDSNTGIRRPADNEVAIVAGGADRFTVSTSTLTAGRSLTMSGYKITDLANGTLTNDAINLSQLNAAVAAITGRLAAVRVFKTSQTYTTPSSVTAIWVRLRGGGGAGGNGGSGTGGGSGGEGEN
jgi:hypothetical protein